MPKVVQVSGVGHVAFPETMPDHEIAGHIAEHLGLKREDRIRGSADLPLTKDGKAQAAEMGHKLAPIGGFHRMAASPLKRTLETARFVSPHAWLKLDSNLGDLHYGAMEGMKSSAAIPVINEYITKHPDTPLPGKSKFSGEPGESFNQYKQRMLPAIHRVIETANQHPHERIAIVMNRRSIKTFQAWQHLGSQSDLRTDPEIATSFHHDDIPNGSLWKYSPHGLTQVEHVGQITPGLYIMRHQATHWNS